MSASTASHSSETNDSGDGLPDWVGYWHVQSWDGHAPTAPTYYAATPESWDVVTWDGGPDPYVAPHPILDARSRRIVLKDEGEPDKNAEQWRAEVEDGVLRVTAVTGPHEGAVGVAERIDTNPRTSPPHAQEETSR
jgi:hypothetical protein